MANKLEGLPGYLPVALRPRCCNCRKSLRPVAAGKIVQVQVGNNLIPQWVYTHIMYYGYDSLQLFCTARCGYEYGCKAARLKGHD